MQSPEFPLPADFSGPFTPVVITLPLTLLRCDAVAVTPSDRGQSSRSQSSDLLGVVISSLGYRRNIDGAQLRPPRLQHLFAQQAQELLRNHRLQRLGFVNLLPRLRVSSPVIERQSP